MNHFCPVFLDPVVKRIAAVRGAQNRAAAREDSRNRLDGKRNGAFRPDQPVEAVVNADDSPAMPHDGGANRAANDGVEPRAISAPVSDADGLNSWSHMSSVMRQDTGPETQEVILHHPPKELEGYACRRSRRATQAMYGESPGENHRLIERMHFGYRQQGI